MKLSTVLKTLAMMATRMAPMLGVALFAHGQSLPYVPYNSMDVASIGAVSFFAASDSLHGVELWRSDGTDTGTYMLADISPGPLASYPRNLTAAFGEVFFIADDGVHGSELWCTDGTPAGTRLVSDINPGAGSSSPQQLTNYNDYLYFLASNGAGPPALWQSDGTANGTILVSNLGGSTPVQVSVINARLQILTTDTTGGSQIWISDGTAAGTLPASSPLLVSATVSWSPVTSTTSGTPLTDLGGYKIYFGASPMALSSSIDVPDPAATTYVVPYLMPGTLYFAVTAYILGGPESSLSTVVGATLN
jgi:ELWxxDGT repeat protein